MSRITAKTDDSASKLQSVMLLYLVVWSISPPLSLDTIYRLVGLTAVFGWFAFEILRGLEFTIQDIEAIMFCLAVIITTYITNGDFGSTLKQIALFMAAIGLMIQIHYKDRWTSLSFIIPIMLAMLIYFNYRTFSTLMTDATIARKIVRNDEAMNAYLKSGVGGYALIYLQVCMFPAILQWTIKALRINKIFFVLGAAWVITYIMVVLNAGYSIAVFTTLASAIILLFYKGKSSVPAIILLGIAFGGAIFSILYLTGFRNYLLKVFDGTAVAKKINDLVASSDSGAAEGSIYSRIKAYQNSLDVILQYPIIGGFWKASGGGHSAILDMIAKYGVFGAFIYCNCLFRGVLLPKKELENYPSILRICNSCFTAILFVSLLDTITFEFMIPLTVMIPVIIYTVADWEERLNPEDESTVDG